MSGEEFINRFFAPRAVEKAAPPSFVDRFFPKAEAPPEPERVGNAGGMAGAATQGAMFGFGDEYLAGLSSVLGLQPDGNGGSSFGNYDKPIGERYDAALGAIRSELGEYQDENPIKSGAAQIGGAVAGAIGGASQVPIRSAATLAGRAKQMVVGGAAAGAVEGFGSGEGGIGNRAQNAVFGAGTGAVFAPVVGFGGAAVARQARKIGGNALAAVFSNRRMVDKATGRLTAAGARRIKQLGFEPGALSKEMQEALGRAATKAAGTVDEESPEVIARVAAAERFDVPVTRGQATGDVAQYAAEENFRAGTRGQGAYETISGFDRMQKSAVANARDRVGASVGGPERDRLDIAERVITGVRSGAENARVAGRTAYEALDASGAGVDGAAAQALDQRLMRTLQMESVNIDAGTPNAMSGIAVLKDAFKGADKGSIPFNSLERARQRLVQLRSAAQRGDNGADQYAVGKVIDEYDAWLDETVTNRLMQGDDQAVGLAKDARGLWAKYRQTYLSKDGADNFIRKIVQDDISPDQVANWLYGASTSPGGGQTSLVAKRVKDILGADSEEFMAVKRGAWDRVTKATEGRKDFGPDRVVSNISELLDGKGKALARELFTPQEMAFMGEYRDMMKVLQAPARAVNSSGTSYDLQRSMQQMQLAAAGLIGGMKGGPIGALAARETVKTGGNFSSTLGARAAAAGLRIKPTSVPVAVGIGAGAGAVTQDQTIR